MWNELLALIQSLMIRGLQLMICIGGSLASLSIAWPARSMFISCAILRPGAWFMHSNVAGLCVRDWEQFAVGGRNRLNLHIFSWWHSEVGRLWQRASWTNSDTQRLVSCHEWKRAQTQQELGFRTEAVKWWKQEVRIKWESLETELHILHFIFLCVFVLPIYEGNIWLISPIPTPLPVWHLGMCTRVSLYALAFECCDSNTHESCRSKRPSTKAKD